MIGNRLAHYEIRERIGNGGMGEVYRARDTRLGRDVALKTLHLDSSRDPELLGRLASEARAVAALNHPNIVTIYSVDEADATPFLTMELVEGKPLSELLRPSGLPLDEFFNLAAPIVEAVRSAHDRGVIHCDLKPTNVMVNGEGRPKILDFGLAKLHRDDEVRSNCDQETLAATMDGRLKGTPAFMSPEQIKGKPATPPSDIFSLGIMLYEMLTGRLPFSTGSMAEAMSSILRDRPESPTRLRTDLPATLAELVMSCLAKEPGLRPDAAQLCERIKAAQKERESGATGTTPSVAVLPFEDMSPEQDQGYFCDGMAEEIINTLAKLDGLRVTPRTSSFRFRGSAEGGKAIASQLGVTTLLEGSMRKAGDQLRIAVQLIDATHERHLWSERYDRQLEDVFKIQDDIAQSIVQALQITLSPGESRALKHSLTDQADAYDFYLRGRQYFFRNSKRDHLYARQMFNRAVEIDPSFTRAYAGFADSSAYIYKHYGHDKTLLDEADAASCKALELDPHLPEAHTSRGIVLWLQGNHEESDREFRVALELDNTIFETHFVFGNYCYSCGRLEEAIGVFVRAEEIRPEDYQSPILLGSLYRGLGRKDEMRAAFQRGLEIARDHLAHTPDDPRAAYLGAAALVALGEVGEGLEWAERARRLDAENPFLLYNMAAIYAGAGRVSEAIDYLESAIAHGWSHMANLHNDPDFDPLRGHPRYAALLDR